MDFFAKATLFFNDQFTAGAAKAKGGFTSMASAAASLGQSNALLDTATKLSVVGNMTEPFRQKLSAAIEGPSILAEGLDSSFKNIQSVTFDSSEEMKALQGELISLGGTSVAGLQATVDTFYDIAGSVTNASVRLPVLKAALAMAEAGQADLGASSKGLVSVMNSYSYSADKASYVSDVLTRTVGMGSGSMGEFVAAMSSVAGTASSVGIGFGDLGAQIAWMTAKGETAAMRSTQLQAAMTALLNPNEKLKKVYASIGVANGDAIIQQNGLAGALAKVSDAVGGSKSALVASLGSVEAWKAATALADSGFSQFAEDFAADLDGITAKSQNIQLEAFSAKMAKLQSAQDVFRAKLGESSNQITGFFAEIQTGFLQMANPILSTPLGEALTPFIAGLGMATEKTLAFGGSAINTVAQLAMIASLARDAGGYTKLFGGMVTALGGGLQTAVVGMGRFVVGTGGMIASALGYTPVAGTATAANTAFAASIWAVAWPVLAVVAGIALLGLGAYLIIKNWKPISAFFVGLWKGIYSTVGKVFSFIWGFCDSPIGQAIITTLFPFIGIPILIAKNWKSISGFFVTLWKGITGIFTWAMTDIWKLFDNRYVQAALIAFVPFLGIPIAIIKNWGGISSFFTSVWSGISSLFEVGVAKVKTIFFGLWDAIKAPFNAVSGFINKLFGGAIASGQASMDAFSTGINQGGGQVAAATNNAFQKPARLFPHSDAPEGPFSTLTASGNALMTTFATGIDAGSGSVATSTARAFDGPGKEIERSAAGMSLAAAFHGPSTTVPLPGSTPDGKKGTGKKAGGDVEPSRQIVQHFHIEKDIVVQAEDIRSALDFVELLMNAAGVPA